MKGNLGQNVRSTIKVGNSFPAVITDTHGDRATVRLSVNGAVIRNLQVIGGPVTVGQPVRVDYTTYEPTVIAPGKTGMTSEDLLQAMKSLGGSIGQNKQFTWNILAFANGVLVGSYPTIATGLIDALAAASSGGVVLLPACTLGGDYTIPAGVNLVGLARDASVISGTVTVMGGGVCNLTVRVDVSDSSAHYGLDIQGVSFIQDAAIYCVQGSTGTAGAVYVHDAGGATIQDCYLHGESASGSGYGLIFEQAQDDVHVIGGYIHGSTAPIDI